MSKSSKKPRQKFSPKQLDDTTSPKPKKEKDWGFEDIARSKTKRH